MKLNSRRTPNVPAVLGELDAQQLQFITEYIALGGRPRDGEAAALKAGYGDGSLVNARRCANTLLASPKITKALREAVAQRFDMALGAAFNTLLDICTNPLAPANARISAAQEILNRSTIGPVPSRSVSVVAQTGIEELWAKLDARKAAEAKTIEVTPGPSRSEPAV